MWHLESSQIIVTPPPTILLFFKAAFLCYVYLHLSGKLCQKMIQILKWSFSKPVLFNTVALSHM